MLRNCFRLAVLILAAVAPVCLSAHSYGPPPSVTAGPADNQLACTQCHRTSALNSGQGSISVSLQTGTVYIPGVKQRVTVRLEDTGQQRWGFELSARLDSDAEKSQAGDFAPVDNFTQVICADAGARPCASGPSYITHTAAGTRPGTPDGASFQFDWTPPAQNAGRITFYLAGNAANGDGSPGGDHIYTASVQLTPAIPQPPSITDSGLLTFANSKPGTFAPNSWAIIVGSNLSVTTRTWDEGDFINGGLPFSIDGVSVLLTTGGVPRLAYVGYVSPTQVNFLLPPNESTAPTTAQVRNPAGISTAVPITVQANAPQLLTVDGQRVMGRHLDGTPLSLDAPANPGESVVVYGTGMGPTNPALIPGQLTGATPLATLPQVTIDGAQVSVESAVIAGGTAGFCDITVKVPTGAANGDLQMVIQTGGTNSPAVLLPVHK
jgi:uncharacterized protein (TIGR03437 family)